MIAQIFLLQEKHLRFALSNTLQQALNMAQCPIQGTNQAQFLNSLQLRLSSVFLFN